MKKYACILLICLVFPFWGCSDSSSGDDPIKSFRAFSGDLKSLVNQESTLAAIELADLSPGLPDDEDPRLSYLTVNEDLVIQLLHINYVCNTVIGFETWSRTGNTYTNENKSTTVTITDGVYTMENVYYEESDEKPKYTVTLTWNPFTSRWLSTADKISVPKAAGEEPEPWFKQEGEWTDSSTAYTATEFYIKAVDEDFRHVINTIFTRGTSANEILAASERETCNSYCVDLDTTDFYDQGVEAAGGPGWVGFMNYQVEDGEADYEIPYVGILK
jgi:hypothetical protein